MEVLSNLERSDNSKRLTAFQFGPEGSDNWTGIDRKKEEYYSLISHINRVTNILIMKLNPSVY